MSPDLEKGRKTWRELSIRDFETARDRELEKLRRIEREAWAGWQRSQQPRQGATVDGEGGIQRASAHCADVRFLDVLLRCKAAAAHKFVKLTTAGRLQLISANGNPIANNALLVNKSRSRSVIPLD